MPQALKANHCICIQACMISNVQSFITCFLRMKGGIWGEFSCLRKGWRIILSILISCTGLKFSTRLFIDTQKYFLRLSSQKCNNQVIIFRLKITFPFISYSKILQNSHRSHDCSSPVYILTLFRAISVLFMGFLISSSQWVVS